MSDLVVYGSQKQCLQAQPRAIPCAKCPQCRPFRPTYTTKPLAQGWWLYLCFSVREPYEACCRFTLIMLTTSLLKKSQLICCWLLQKLLWLWADCGLPCFRVAVGMVWRAVGAAVAPPPVGVGVWCPPAGGPWGGVWHDRRARGRGSEGPPGGQI